MGALLGVSCSSDQVLVSADQVLVADGGVVTIVVDDLDAWVDEIAARGLEPDERLTYSNRVREAVYRDPDGNEPASGVRPSSHADAARHATIDTC